MITMNSDCFLGEFKYLKTPRIREVLEKHVDYKGVEIVRFIFSAFGDPEICGRFRVSVHEEYNQIYDQATGHNLINAFEAICFLSCIVGKSDFELVSNVLGDSRPLLALPPFLGKQIFIGNPALNKANGMKIPIRIDDFEPIASPAFRVLVKV